MKRRILLTAKWLPRSQPASARTRAAQSTPPQLRSGLEFKCSCRAQGLFLKAADILERRMPEIAKITAEETGQTFGWGMFNCIFTVGILREAAAQAYGMIGEVIPTDLPDNDRHGHSSGRRRGRGHCSLECADDPGHARRRTSGRLRKHRRAQGLGGISWNASGDRVRVGGKPAFPRASST